MDQVHAVKTSRENGFHLNMILPKQQAGLWLGGVRRGGIHSLTPVAEASSNNSISLPICAIWVKCTKVGPEFFLKLSPEVRWYLSPAHSMI
jgi:hypothetical protein